MIILNPFLLQQAALLGRELVILAALGGAEGAALMIDEIRLAVVGTLTVGPSLHLHLKKAEIDPELQFLAAVTARNFPDFDRAGLMRPIFQKAV